MKTLSRIFTAAFILFAAASCHTNEIDNPDNPNQKGKSEITITASIIQTRVSYDCSDLREVKQHWEENDILFGFWGGSASNRIVFQVEKVDSGTGIATLKVLSPEKWIDTAADETKVDLVYTGDDDIANLPFSASGIDVDLSGQSLDRVPGCMHAQAALQVDEDGNKSLEFIFQNDCALIEIDGLPGAVEDWGYISSGQQVTSVGISQISIPNLYLKGSYSYNGSLSFATSNFEPEECVITLELDPTEWSINNQGFINGPNDFQGYPQKILIAVAPYLEELPFLVTATIPSLGEFPDIEYDYNYKQLEKGNCYVISPQPVVARTADGQYFTSVSGAFDHAKQLKDTYDSEETNIVTLVQDCGLAGVIKNGNTYNSNVGVEDSPIVIDDYNVSLDLNGHILKISGDESFYVNCDADYAKYTGKSNVFTIMDSKTGGTIESTSDDYIVRNYGTVNITGGDLIHNNECDVVSNSGTLNVSGGKLRSGYFVVENNKGCEAYISGGELSTIEYEDTDGDGVAGYIVIDNYGTLEVSGGTLCNVGRTWNEEKSIWSGKPVIWNDPGAELTVKGTAVLSSTYGSVVYNESYSDDACTIEGGTLSSIYDIVVENYGTCNILGGTLYSESNAAIQSNGGTINITGGIISNSATAAETIQILSGAECRISGGVVYSTKMVATITCHSTSNDAKNSKLWITWPIIINPDAEEPQYDQESGEDLCEPLIYSFGSAMQNSPVSAYHNNDYNTAEVYIQGGYLLTHNHNDHGGFFYNDDRTMETDYHFTNLKFSDCGNFYTNNYKANSQGSTYSSNCDLDLRVYSDVNGKKFDVTTYSDLQYTPDFFEGYFDEDDFDEGFPEETVLYYFEFK